MDKRGCKVCPKLLEEYENALKYEALSYGRLIAHKRRHEDVDRAPRATQVHHMQLVGEIARRYEEGITDPHGDTSPNQGQGF